MKNKLSLKIALAHLCGFAATSSFAYLPVLPDAKVNNRPWYGALTATLMQPSNINYREDLAGPEFESKFLNPDFQFGLNALVGRFITEQDDVSANYTYNEFTDSGTSFSNVVPVLNNFRNFESTSYKVNYDALDLSIGHYFNTERWKTHLYGGINYTYIQQIKTEVATFVNSPFVFPQDPINARSKLTFNGVGPQFGVETGFKLTNQFKLVGGVNLAVLASNISLTGNPNTFNGALKTQANLGASYDYMLKNNTQVSIEAGYKTVVVHNITDGGEGGATAGRYSFAMNGPYLGIGVTC